MAIAVVKRPLSVTSEPLSVALSTGAMKEIADAYYLPLTVDNIAIPDVVATTVNGSIGSAVITSLVAGAFDAVKVGDIVATFGGTGSVAASTGIINDVNTFSGLKFIVYPDNESTPFDGRAGDAITGTGIPANTFIDKLDADNRTVYLTNAATMDGSITVTVTKLARVIAVSKSTETVAPNTITISRNLTGELVNTSLTIKSGIKEAVFAVLRMEPLDSATSSRVEYSMGIHYPQASTLVPTVDGLGVSSYNTLGYSNLQRIGFDADSYLEALGVPRTGVGLPQQ